MYLLTHQGSKYLPSTQLNFISSFLSGRNAKTIEAYRQDLESFRQYLEADTLDQAAQVLLSHGHGTANGIALQYKTYLVERGLAPATINRRLAALRSLVKLARTLGMTTFTLEIENVKHQSYRDTKGPGKAGFKAMLAAAMRQKRKPKCYRDAAILRLLYDLGLRRGEVVGIDLEDLDLEAGTVAILGKGRTQKVSLTLPAETKAALSSWVEIRGEHPGALFTNLDPAKKGGPDKRLSGTAVYQTIRRLGLKVGIRTRPHGLRHAAITQALELTNGNYQAVAKFSRHKSVQILMVYDDNRQDLGGAVAAMVAANSNL